MNDLSNNWETFVRLIAQAYAEGLSEREAGAKVAGMRVNWSGKMAELQLKNGTPVAVAVAMSHSTIHLSDGLLFVADHLSLPLASVGSREVSRFIKVGQQVHFRATVADNDGVFPPIGFALDEESRKVFLILGLRDAEIDL